MGLAGSRGLTASEGASADIHRHSGLSTCFASFWSLVLGPGNVFLVPKANDLAFAGLEIEGDFVHRFVGLVGNGIQSPGALRNSADLSDRASGDGACAGSEADGNRIDLERAVGVSGIGGVPFANELNGD